MRYSMVNYKLQPNESIILKSDSIMYGGIMSGYTDELILTNQNIIHISKGLFNKVKSVQKFSVNQIKIVDQQPQVFRHKRNNGNYQLEIHLRNRVEVFGFIHTNKKEIVQWINAIFKLLTGETSNITNTYNIPGMDVLSEKIKETADTLKNTFGINFNKPSSKNASERVTKKCIACAAPISGNSGEMIHCKYCDTDQVI